MSCETPHHEDKRLSVWTSVLKTTDPYSQPANTTLKESWPYVYVYCFRLKITIRQKTVKCPPYVFKLNATIPWNTTDMYYDPKTHKLEKEIETDQITHEIHAVHFATEEHIIDRNVAIEEVIRLNKEKEKMIQETVALKLPVAGASISYSSALQLMLWMTGFGFMTMLGLIVYRYFEDKKKHQKIMRTVTDGIYGDGTYEMVRSVKRHRTSRSSSESSQVTVPAQVNVTLNGPSNSNVPPPIPPYKGGSVTN